MPQIAARVAPAPDAAPLLGSTFLRTLHDTRPTHAPLQVGTRRWSTDDLATKLGIVHKAAAKRVSAALSALHLTSVAEIYRTTSPETFAAFPGFGVTCLYVIWKLLRSEGFDPNVWEAREHGPDQQRTFSTMKVKYRKLASSPARRRRRR